MTGKLYGTLGPACADTDTLRALLRAGMRGVRLKYFRLESEIRRWSPRRACAVAGKPAPRRDCGGRFL